MKPNDERELTFEEEVQALMKTFVPLEPKLQPRNAMERAKRRWFPREWKWDVSARRAIRWMKRKTEGANQW
jgi:hypothetical protein